MIHPDLKPNTTNIPNIILDILMPQLDGTEEKIVRVICRQTYGWHKFTDKISMSQLIEKTGMQEKALKRSMRKLCDNRIVIRNIGGGRNLNEYSINYQVSEWVGVNMAPPAKKTPSPPPETPHPTNRIPRPRSR